MLGAVPHKFRIPACDRVKLEQIHDQLTRASALLTANRVDRGELEARSQNSNGEYERLQQGWEHAWDVAIEDGDMGEEGLLTDDQVDSKTTTEESGKAHAFRRSLKGKDCQTNPTTTERDSGEQRLQDANNSLIKAFFLLKLYHHLVIENEKSLSESEGQESGGAVEDGNEDSNEAGLDVSELLEQLDLKPSVEVDDTEHVGSGSGCYTFRFGVELMKAITEDMISIDTNVADPAGVAT